MDAFADALLPLENDNHDEAEARWEGRYLVDPQSVQQEQQQG